MDDLPLDSFAEALKLLEGYYRALVTKLAEEIVENRDNFDVSYTGKAEEIIDRYGLHLQSLARICLDLSTVSAAIRGEQGNAAQGAPVAESWPPAVEPPGRPVGPDTPLEIGSPVLVWWGETWWPAQILSLEPEGEVRIRYTGWGAGWDETVPRSRLQQEITGPPEGG